MSATANHRDFTVLSLFNVGVSSSRGRKDVLRVDCWKATGAANLLQEIPGAWRAHAAQLKKFAPFGP